MQPTQTPKHQEIKETETCIKIKVPNEGYSQSPNKDIYETSETEHDG
jgi:hypothetical protein